MTEEATTAPAPKKRAPRKKAAPKVTDAPTPAPAAVTVPAEPVAFPAEPVAARHAPKGNGCVCGWLPNYRHALGLAIQQRNHLQRNGYKI